MNTIIKTTIKYLGWRNWAVLSYNSVAENMFVFFYIALVQRFDFFTFLAEFIIFFGFSVICTSYGYLVNDLGDRELDRLHGKDNTFTGDSPLKASFVVLLFLGFSIPFGLYFVKKDYFLLLWLVWFAISTSYSMEPIRLKERGKAGLLLVVMAQRVIPALMIFSAFDFLGYNEFILLTIYIFFRGLSSDLNHQIEDYENDLKTSTGTFAVKTGDEKTRMLFRISLEFEKIMLLVCLCICCYTLNDIRFLDYPVILLLVISYIVVYAINVVLVVGDSTVDVSPFGMERKNIFQFIHHTFPTIIITFYLLCMLVSIDWRYVSILILFMLYRGFFSMAVIGNSYFGIILNAILIRIRILKEK